jgi:hypothetical protein
MTIRRVPARAKIFFDYTDKEGVKRRGWGWAVNLEGQTVDLFPSGVLCGMLGRSQKCLYKWEKEFNFPPALFRLLDDPSRSRWYSRKQLIAIRTIYEACGKLAGKDRDKLKQFIAAVRRVFTMVDQPAKERDNGG